MVHRVMRVRVRWKMGANQAELNRMVASLEMSGAYRVLERFELQSRYGEPGDAGDIRSVMFVATETTGVSAFSDVMFELGYVVADVDTKTGYVLRIGGKYQGFESPARPLGAYISELTGVGDEDIKGKRFDDARVEADLAKVDLVVSHNAGLERPFLEKRFKGFEEKWFACSGIDVDWLAYGSRLKNLEFLAYKLARVFFEGRRALSQAEMMVHVLAQEVPDIGVPMAEMLQNSRGIVQRVWADGAAPQVGAMLKAAGYVYSSNTSDLDIKRTWYRETGDVQSELLWLAGGALPAGAMVTVDVVTGRERFTGRVKKRVNCPVGNGDAGSTSNESSSNDERRRTPLPV